MVIVLGYYGILARIVLPALRRSLDGRARHGGTRGERARAPFVRLPPCVHLTGRTCCGR
jgi:hypothetical protein